MRIFRLLLAALAALIALALLAAWQIPGRLDWNRYRGTIEALASVTLGRPVTIAGPITLSLLPETEITAADVVVAGDAPGEQPGASALVVHALLESPSATGAYRFTVRPGDQTTMDVESVVFPRVDIAQVGLATLTSMFTFGPASHTGFDDWRPAVHDSEGLQIWTGRGEHVWRPLTNPRALQVSAFGDLAPRGFGLMQRSRNFSDYEDLETDYELRPSLWVEPIGAPGEGAVLLVEIPTRSEVHDNIVAFWRPKNPLKAKSENGFTYRLHWGDRAPIAEEVARIVGTFTGTSFSGKTREFVLDVSGGKLRADSVPRLVVTADHGVITVPSVVLNTAKPNDTWRASFELDPQGAPVVELRARLVDDSGTLSETWLYRWSPA